VRVLRVLPARRAARDDGTRVARGGPDHARRHRDELVTRLVRSGRRVEVPARPTPVVQHRTVVGDLGRRSTDVAPERRAGAAAPWGGSATGPVTTSGAAVDLDRLTDQVVSRLDSRLTAHRERFGRAF
jgi:hypothetical protein